MRFRLTALALLAGVASCEPTAPEGPSVPANETFAASLAVDIPNMVKVSDDLYYKDITVGTGTPAAAYGKTITAYYTGYLKDGQQFDSNVGKDSLVVVLSDASGLIAGWILGIPGMKPGGVRKLVIGSAYGYGAKGASSPGRVSIPPNATLVFDISLVAVK